MPKTKKARSSSGSASSTATNSDAWKAFAAKTRAQLDIDAPDLKGKKKHRKICSLWKKHKESLEE